jgi:cytochrome b6-f complex iron-sulfur subunit
MEREAFIKALSLGLISVCVGCTNNGTIPSPDPQSGNKNGGTTGGTTGGTPPKLASNQRAYDLTKNILTVGSQLRADNILLFRIASGNNLTSFVAVQGGCTHQGSALNWQNNKVIVCSNHGAQFNTAGKNTLGPDGQGSTGNLKVYTTSISGNYLIVTIA